MGWTISHAPYGETVSRSAGTLHNLSRQVAHVLTAADWRVVKPLFDQAQRAGGPFEFGWHQAGRLADVLRLAATDGRMPKNWAALAHQLADAAETAAKNRESWRWR